MWELPPKAELIAWSEKTGVEMFKYGDHIMGIQGHPEYTKDILLNLIDRLVKLDYILVRSNYFILYVAFLCCAPIAAPMIVTFFLYPEICNLGFRN